MNKKYFILCLIVFVFSFCFITIGFATYTNDLTIEDIGVNVRQPLDVRVTNVVLDNASTGTVIENLDYNMKNIMGDVNLPENGYVTFNVEFTNYANYPVYLMGITNLPDNLKFEIDINKENRYVLKDLFIENTNELKEISITISYKDGGFNSENQLYNMNLGFYFESSYTILFHGNLLPDAYQQLDYIESSGTQYIDTEVPSGNNNLKFEIQYSMVKFPDYGKYAGIFGAYQAETSNATRMIYNGINGGGARSLVYVNSIANGSGLIDNSARSLNIIYTETLERVGNTTRYTSNSFSGVLEKSNVAGGSTLNSNIAVFAQNATGSIASSMKLYYFKIYDKGVKIRDFIPCYRKSDGVIGLYDKVTSTFFKNKGTGSFVKGNEVDEITSQNVLTSQTAVLNKNTFNYDSYVFMGWNTEDDGSGISYKDSQEIFDLAYNNEVVNLYAQWRPYQVKINFYANGGMGTMDSIVIPYGGKVSLKSNTFIRGGYKFVEWNTNADGSGTMYNNNAEIEISATNDDVEVSLYAQWSRRLLPNEYVEVKYIESTGSQYINTNVLSNNDYLKFEIQYSMVELPNNGSYVGIFGAYSSETSNATRLLYAGQSGGTAYVYGYINSIASGSALKDIVSRKTNTIYTETLEKNGSVTSFKSNAFSNLLTYNNPPKGTEFSGNIVIFNHGENTNIFSKMRLYYFKIYDNENMIRYFIPCYRKSDGVIGLYDVVNLEFYTNKGTGTFVKGQDL